MDYGILTENITDTIMRNQEVQHTGAWRLPWYDEDVEFHKKLACNKEIDDAIDQYHEAIKLYTSNSQTISPDQMAVLTAKHENMKDLVSVAYLGSR
jgi:hypothetical protein